MPYYTVNGIQLHYQIAGAGYPLLLLHGLGSTSDDWQLQIPSFAERYQVIAPDLRGHGLSAKPRGPYAIRDFASDIVALLDHLHLSQANILGLSLGGMVAQQMALGWPERVASLLLANTFPRFYPWEPRFLRRIAQRLVNFSKGGMEETAAAVGASLSPLPAQRPLARETARRFARNDVGGYQASVRAILRFNVESQIHAIQCPTLVIASDRDRTINWLQKARTAKLIPGARLAMIQDSGHASPLDQPAHFNRVVLEFLATQNQH